MVIFWIIVAVLLIVALGFVLPSLLRSVMRKPKFSREDANTALYKGQFAELEADLAAGILSEAQYQESRRELERRLLDDVPAISNTRLAPPVNRPIGIFVSLAVPLLALLLYWQLGKPSAISADAAPHVNSTDVNAMIASLATRLESNPQDAQGWLLLGRSYVVVERYPEARDTYAKAYALLGDQPDLLADYAEAQALADGGHFSKQTTDLLGVALKSQPDHMKALSLAGMAAFQANDFRSAAQHWNRLSQLIPPQSEDGKILRAYLAKAQARVEKASVNDSSAKPIRGVRVRVELDPRVASKAAPDDAVFVFARAVDGPKMPLAIARRQVKDLPLEITLDDSMAMSEDLKISAFDKIKLGARISHSGSATPQRGDLTALSQEIAVKNNRPVISIKIDQVLP